MALQTLPKPERVTVFAAVFAAVLHTPKCVIFALPSKFIPSMVLAVARTNLGITPANIGAAASSHGTHVTFSTTAPVMEYLRQYCILQNA